MSVFPDSQRLRFSFHGHAIVTADGMIADPSGQMPEPLRNEADWQAFQAALDVAALVVLGRLGHERHPNPGRRRLVLTRSVSTLTPDERDPLALLWNPLATPFARVLAALEIAGGVIAVTGGTGVFAHFLPVYDHFALSEANRAVLPGGIPCFAAGHPRQVLAAAGLVPGEATLIDAAAGVTSTPWSRPA